MSIEQKSSRRKYMIVAVVLIVVLIGAAAGYWYILRLPPTAEKKIRILSTGTIQPASYDEVNARFTEKTGIEVEVTIAGDVSAEHAKQMADWLAGTTSYDIVQVQTIGWMVELILRDYIQPLDDVAEEIKPKCIPGMERYWETATWDGHIYAVPCTLAILNFFYRTDIFEMVGIEGPPTTWEEVKEYAEKTTLDLDGDGIIDIYGLVFSWADDDLWLSFGSTFQPMFHTGFDKFNWFITHDLTKCIANDEGAVKAIEFMKSLLPYTDPQSLLMSSSGGRGRIFQAGGAAMMLNNPYQFAWNDDPENSKIIGKWAACRAPGSEWAGKESFTSWCPIVYTLTKDAKNVEAAKEYLRFRNSEEFWEWNVQAYPGGGTWTWIKSVYDKYYADNPSWQWITECWDGDLHIMFITPADFEIFKKFEVHFQRFVGDKVDAQTALDMFVAEADARIAQGF